MSAEWTDLAGRIARVQTRLESACRRAGRSVSEVTLLAISKTQPPEAVAAAAACGLRLFGENKVQEAAAKIPLCPDALEWHLVGHLQSNKVRLAAQLFSMIHSVDSADLLRRMDQICGELGRRMRVCLEINVAGEASKFGLSPEQAPAVLDTAQGLNHVELAGFMTIPPFAEDPGKTRDHFRALRKLRDAECARTGFALPELSMGMSHDFEIAIEEGATLVRVGTDIFGARG